MMPNLIGRMLIQQVDGGAGTPMQGGGNWNDGKVVVREGGRKEIFFWRSSRGYF